MFSIELKRKRGEEPGESMEQRILGNHLKGSGQSLVLLVFVEGKEGVSSFIKKDLSA